MAVVRGAEHTGLFAADSLRMDYSRSAEQQILVVDTAVLVDIHWQMVVKPQLAAL